MDPSGTERKVATPASAAMCLSPDGRQLATAGEEKIMEAIRARLLADTEIELWSQEPDWRARQQRNSL